MGIGLRSQSIGGFYNAYQVKGHHELLDDTAVDFSEDQLSQMAWFSLFGATWQTGYLLNQYIFASDRTTGPMGDRFPPHWERFGPCLLQAVVVSLSASSKTTRGFAWQVLNKRDLESGPLGFLQVTQARGVIQGVAASHGYISSEVFDYSQLESAAELVAGFNLRSIVIVDFGARYGALEELVGLLREKERLKGV